MVPLGRAMECSYCGHDEHLLRCEALVAPGVRCPCHRVPTPGVHPDDDTDCSTA